MVYSKFGVFLIVLMVIGIPIYAVTSNGLINSFSQVSTGNGPVASNMTIQLGSNTSYAGKLNATNAKTYNITTKPVHGTLTLNKTNGKFVYRSNTNFTGTDSFKYNANNGTRNSNTATVKITIKNKPTPVTNASKTIYVAKNGTDKNDGLTIENPKRNLQIAVNYANAGDTIKIGPGTYIEVPLEIRKDLIIQGSNQNNTIIDAQNGPNTCIYIPPGNTVTITDITIKNSDVNYGGINQKCSGGGIYNVGVLTLNKSTITNNKAHNGAGIENWGIMTLNEVKIENNPASWSGGGIRNGNTITIFNSNITGNNAEFGGGICNEGRSTSIINCSITRNNADYGGGIEGPTTIINTTISQNNATIDGGGICSGSLILQNSIITNNSASRNGGGIKVGYVFDPGTGIIYNSVITNNTAFDGGGIYNTYRSYVDDATLIRKNLINNVGGCAIIPA